MALLLCPKCGCQAAPDAVACPDCGHDMKNGTVLQGGCPVEKAAVPPEVHCWIIERTPPDLLAWARQTFNEEEHMAGVREIEQTGGLKFEDFIDEIERRAEGRE
jgi:hypothetical protein